MEIVVITGVPDPAKDGGNLAMAGTDLRWEIEAHDERGLPLTRPFMEVLQESNMSALSFILNLREPVFHVGEVLILNEYGREIGYPGRKPDKWSVEVTPASTLEEAHEIAQKAMKDEWEASSTG